jgi:hypothetical protein
MCVNDPKKSVEQWDLTPDCALMGAPNQTSVRNGE